MFYRFFSAKFWEGKWTILVHGKYDILEQKPESKCGGKEAGTLGQNPSATGRISRIRIVRRKNGEKLAATTKWHNPMDERAGSIVCMDGVLQRIEETTMKAQMTA